MTARGARSRPWGALPPSACSLSVTLCRLWPGGRGPGLGTDPGVRGAGRLAPLGSGPWRRVPEEGARWAPGKHGDACDPPGPPLLPQPPKPASRASQKFHTELRSVIYEPTRAKSLTRANPTKEGTVAVSMPALWPLPPTGLLPDVLPARPRGAPRVTTALSGTPK